MWFAGPSPNTDFGSPARFPAVSSLVLALSLTLAWWVCASADMSKTLTPRISVGTEYDDNVNLSPTEKDSDLITTVSPGVSLSLESPQTVLDFDYEAGFSFYRDDSSNDSTRHRVTAAWNQALSRHLTFDLSDSFLRTEDTVIETDGIVEDIRQDRDTTYRNTGEASLSYAFGTEDQITAGYQDRYVDDRSPDDQDSRGHRGFMSLDKWFGPRYGIGLNSHYERGKFEQKDDFDDYGMGLALNYRWVPSRTAFLRYDFLDHDFDEPSTQDDYQVHQGTIGFDLGLSPQTDLHLEGGYYYQDYRDRSSEEGVTYAGTLATRTQRTVFTFEGSGGFDQDYYSSDNFGSSEFREVSGRVDHQLLSSLAAFLSGSYRWEKYRERADQEDKTYGVRGGLSYGFWQWFTLGLEGAHLTRDSDDPTREFDDNRVMLRLTAAYPVRL